MCSVNWEAPCHWSSGIWRIKKEHWLNPNVHHHYPKPWTLRDLTTINHTVPKPDHYSLIFDGSRLWVSEETLGSRQRVCEGLHIRVSPKGKGTERCRQVYVPRQRLQQACLRDCIHVAIECESVCSDSPSGAPAIGVMTGRELGRRPGAGGWRSEGSRPGGSSWQL